MTDHRDYSADCFTGNHAACRFRGCDCACHRPDEMFTEPAPYKAVPAYTEPAMCPNCEQRLQHITHQVHWCPRCGTLLNEEAGYTPSLIPKLRQYESLKPRYQDDPWWKLGIGESINKAENYCIPF